MYNLTRRLNKAEKVLNLSREHSTVKIVCYGGKLPPERIQGNITIQYVMYENGAGQ